MMGLFLGEATLLLRFISSCVIVSFKTWESKLSAFLAKSPLSLTFSQGIVTVTFQFNLRCDVDEQ